MRRLSMPSMMVLALATAVATSVSAGVAHASTPHHALVRQAHSIKINHRTGLPVGMQPTRGQVARASEDNAASRQMSSVQTSASTSYHLTYNGGPVVSNVQVQPVLWGTGASYIPQVASTTAPSMQSFSAALAAGPYQGLLSEYSVTGQTIGAGSANPQVAIDPSVGAPNSTIYNSDIENELFAQIFQDTGSPLYQPTVDAQKLANTAYVLYFPSTVTICQDAPHTTDCSNNVFCGYHDSFGIFDNTTQARVGDVRFVVLPDPDSNWMSGCSSANASTPFTALESVASHELAETITDPEPNEATAWYDGNGSQSDPGEIADICETVQYPYQDTAFVGTDSQGYVLQNVWSNSQNACVPRISASLTSAPSAFSLGHTASYHFGSSDSAGTTGVTYDVAYKSAAWNGAWSARTSLISGTSATSATLPLRPGTEYCVVVRAHDPQGFASRWSAPRCTTTPLDDRAFAARTSGWGRTAVSAAYRGTVTRSGKTGAQLLISNATATQLGLVVATCSTCGNVQIWLGKSLWKTVSTRSTGVHYQHLALPGTFSLRKVSVTIRVASGLVIFDGLGISRSAPTF